MAPHINLAMTQHQFLPQWFLPIAHTFPHTCIYSTFIFSVLGPFTPRGHIFSFTSLGRGKGAKPLGPNSNFTLGAFAHFGAQCPGAFAHCNSHFLIWGLLPIFGPYGKGAKLVRPNSKLYSGAFAHFGGPLNLILVGAKPRGPKTQILLWCFCRFWGPSHIPSMRPNAKFYFGGFCPFLGPAEPPFFNFGPGGFAHLWAMDRPLQHPSMIFIHISIFICPFN
jgi:hypothetical protein